MNNPPSSGYSRGGPHDLPARPTQSAGANPSNPSKQSIRREAAQPYSNAQQPQSAPDQSSQSSQGRGSPAPQPRQPHSQAPQANVSSDRNTYGNSAGSGADRSSNGNGSHRGRGDNNSRQSGGGGGGGGGRDRRRGSGSGGFGSGGSGSNSYVSSGQGSNSQGSNGQGGSSVDNRQSRLGEGRDRGAGDAPLDVDGQPIVMPATARPFEELTSIDPQPRLSLEYPGCPASCRLIDMFCPIGRGQRALIVSPPKAGKTTLLKDIGTAIMRNYTDIEVVVLLVDERPEEVTDFRRHFAKVAESLVPKDLVARGEAALAEQGIASEPAVARSPRVRVIASSNDHNTEKHIEIAMTTIARAKNMVVAGKHVVILLDSITRLGRAFNHSRKHANSGRTMSGGLDSKALEIPRALFGAARNTDPAEGGGSLTIIGSCLVDTGSQADQVIFEEFKGSGNMELILDRAVAERRLFPAMNLGASGTRKENLLLGEKELATISALRRGLLTMQPPVQIEKLLAAIARTPTNAALLGA